MVAMTDLVSRPPGPRAPRRPPAGPPARPVTVAGALAALQAAGLGVLGMGHVMTLLDSEATLHLVQEEPEQFDLRLGPVRAGLEVDLDPDGLAVLDAPARGAHVPVGTKHDQLHRQAS
jgi:hypothetical protein